MASNFGGAWERQIRSVPNTVAALMKQHGHSLDDESLETVLCEVEAVVNSRPLTTESLSDPLSPLPLTPSTLLTGKTKLILPALGKFQRDVYCKRRWRRVQHIDNLVPRYHSVTGNERSGKVRFRACSVPARPEIRAFLSLRMFVLSVAILGDFAE